MSDQAERTAACNLELLTGRLLRVNGEYDTLRKWLKESEGMTLPALHFETPAGSVTVRRACVVSVAPVTDVVPRV